MRTAFTVLALVVATPVCAADRPDDIVALVVRDEWAGKPGLYVSPRRTTGTYERVGTIDLFCTADSPGWAIIRMNGRLVAINGTGKTSARKGMIAYLRDGSTQPVALATDVPGAEFPDDYKAIEAALAPCKAEEPEGIQAMLVKMREAAARYPTRIGEYQRSR